MAPKTTGKKIKNTAHGNIIQNKNTKSSKSKPDSVGTFLQSLVTTKKQNVLSSDQLDNYKYGFDVSEKTTKELARNCDSNNDSDSDSDTSEQYVVVDSLPPNANASASNDKADTGKPVKRKRFETVTENTRQGKAMRIDERESQINYHVQNFDMLDEDFDDALQPQLERLPSNNWNIVPTVDENGNAVVVSPWKARVGTFGEHYFNAGIFQLVAKSKDNIRCLVKCTICPEAKSTFFVRISNNSNLTRHLKTVRSIVLFLNCFFN